MLPRPWSVPGEREVGREPTMRERPRAGRSPEGDLLYGAGTTRDLSDAVRGRRPRRGGEPAERRRDGRRFLGAVRRRAGVLRTGPGLGTAHRGGRPGRPRTAGPPRLGRPEAPARRGPEGPPLPA